MAHINGREYVPRSVCPKLFFFSICVLALSLSICYLSLSLSVSLLVSCCCTRGRVGDLLLEFMSRMRVPNLGPYPLLPFKCDSRFDLWALAWYTIYTRF